MRRGGARQPNDLLLRWLIGVTVGLALLHVILAVVWRRGEVLVALPWYVPMMHSFQALAALGVAFLSFGRYAVLREPTSFWTGSAFSALAILAIFYVLSWPGLLPDERGVIAQLPNTSGWLYNLQFSFLVVMLLVAPLAPWPRAAAPGERWWPWLAVAGAVFTVAVGSLSVTFERYLPVLVVDGTFTPLFLLWFSALVIAFAAGAVLSTHRYRQGRDRLLGYVAIAEVMLGFAMLTSIIGAERYDPWWYWRRFLLVGAFSAVLFGLLSEYVGLYRQERARTLALEALQQVTDPTLARGEVDRLLESLLQRVVAIMGADAGTILLLEPDGRELVLTKGLGIPKDAAGRQRLRVGEGFAGRVVALNSVYWVEDARTDPTVSCPYLRRAGIRGMIGAPLRIGDEVIGVVEVGFREPRKFEPQDERLLEVVAERAAQAIRQARLLEDAQEERNRLRVLVETAPIGITFHAAPDGRLVLYNREFERLLGRAPVPGLDPKQAPAYYGLYRPSGERFPAEELPPLCSLRGETCTGVEIVVRQPSGNEVYVLANSAPLRDGRGRIIGAVATYQDITPIKQQERLRDEFISAAAHELKTPVTTIKGYAQLMRKWVPKGRDARESQAIDAINTQADRISLRVQEMLEAVRIRTSPPELHRTRFDLGDLASEVVQRIQGRTRIHRLVLERREPTPVEADRERIERVLVTLLDNAIKYSPEGGSIEVRVWAQEGEAVVSVTDHGVGIPRERQPHVFEPFYEAVPPGAPGYRSVVALSLYLSKATVESHNGRMWFESEEGKGSTFYFTLPLARNDGNGTRG